MASGIFPCRAKPTPKSLCASAKLGASAIDRYVELHAELASLERRINDGVEHPLMKGFELPYPLLVGRIQAGTWSSRVPDELVFEGRLGVRVGEDPAEARAALERAVAAADDGAGPPAEGDAP